MDDVLGGFPDFESGFAFLRDHFLPRIEWAGLKLSFKKLRLFCDQVTALGTEHQIGAKASILPDRVRRIAKWPTPSCIKEVRSCLGALGLFADG